MTRAGVTSGPASAAVLEEPCGIGGHPPSSVDIAVVDPDPGLRSLLARQIDAPDRVVTYPDVTALADGQPSDRALVAVFGPGMADGPGLAEVERFTRSRPDAGAILVVPELSTTLLRQALRLGVRDVVGAPTDPLTLRESIDRVAQTLPPALPTKGPERGHVISVSSMKGGSGKTVVATNLAVALARRSPDPVALIDVDLQFGDVAVMIRLNPQRTIVDALAAVERSDAQFLRSILATHDPSGLLVLPAPLDPALAERVTERDMHAIIGMLRTFCSHVVIDTPAHFNDVVLAALEASDDIVVVAGMEVPNIKNTKLGIQTLRRLGIPESKLKLVVNRADSKVQLDVAQVERALGLEARIQLPSDILVPQSVNRGVPVVLEAPRSDIARAFEQLADLFVSSPADPRRRRGRFGRATT
jgi:pilus assembly protein CpaE